MLDQPSEPDASRFVPRKLTSSTSSHRPAFAAQVDVAVEASSSVPMDQLRAAAEDDEDDDKWLEVSPDELDGMLQKVSGRAESTTDQAPRVAEEDGKALGDLAKKVEDFVGGQGDIEGARFVE